MSKGMPEGLRKHFEEKEGKEGKKEEHKEALRKARKAKMKRRGEKEGTKSWLNYQKGNNPNAGW